MSSSNQCDCLCHKPTNTNNTSHVNNPTSCDDIVILICCNIQNDYFSISHGHNPSPPYDVVNDVSSYDRSCDTMNHYWVGKKESERILGYHSDFNKGPLGIIIKWMRNFNDIYKNNNNNNNINHNNNKISSSSTSSSSSSIFSSSSSSSLSCPSCPHCVCVGSFPNVYTIYLRTLIDPALLISSSMIEKFGHYCIAGSSGAKLCNNYEDEINKYPNEW